MKKISTSRCFLTALLLGATLLAAPPPAQAQGPWQWATPSVSTVTGRAWAEQNVTDAAGDVYVTGSFQGTVNFPGAGSLTSLGSTLDIFVGKLNGTTGAWIWVAQGADPSFSVGYGITVDNLGNVFVTGKFNGTFVQFAPLPPLPGIGGDDVFVAKFDAATGACLANVAGGGGGGDDVGRSIAWLPQVPGTPPGGFLVVTGDFTSAAATFGGTTVTNTVVMGTSDIFVSQLSAGILNWNNTISVGGAGNDRGQGITAVSSTSATNPPTVYVTGGFESGTIVFGSFPLTNYSGSGTPDIYVGKLDLGLTWQWVAQAGGIGRDEGQDVVYDPTSGDVYATGHFENLGTAAGTLASFGTSTFPPSSLYGGTDVFVARLKATNGQWVWARQAGGAADDTGYSIARDVSGRIYAVGSFDSPAGLFGSTTLPNSSPGVGDVFVSKLTNAGGWLWSRADGGPGPDEAKGVALTAPATVFVSGGFFTPSSFSPFTLTSFSRDAWVGRLPGTVPNLIVSTTMNVPPGGYGTITVTGTGVAILTGPVLVAGGVVVQNGGVWTSNCNILSGPGTFTLQAGGTINICSLQGISQTGPTGDIQVTGLRTFSTDAIYRYVNPGGTQISGTGLTGARDMEVVTTGGVNLTQGIFVRRMLLLSSSGNLNLSGMALTLQSIIARTAMVANTSTGTVLGNTARHERWVDATFSFVQGYRHISSPMTNSIIADLTCAGYTPVVNPAYDAQFNPTPSPLPRVFGFDETLKPTSPVFGYAYYSPPSLATPMGVGVGWSAYMKGSIKPVFRGTLQQSASVVLGPFTQTGGFLAPTDKSGWQLIGNPYPSPITLSAVTLPANMSANASKWTTTGGTSGFYTSYPIGSGAPQWLPVAQGFYVRALVNGAGPLVLPNACRPSSFVTPDPPFYRPATPAAGRPTARLTLRALGKALYEPEATVWFDAAAALELDAADAQQPTHNVGNPTLLSLTPLGEEMVGNGLPEMALASGLTVPLLLDLPEAGTYELRVAELANLGATPVALLDRLTGTRYDLTQQPTMRFAAAQAGELRGRFELVFGQRVTGSAAALTSATALAVWPNPAHGTVRVTVPAGATRLDVFDATGRVIRTLAATPGTDLTVADLPSGVYVVRCGAHAQRLVVE